MKRIMLLAALSLIAAPAHAADMPVKAAPLSVYDTSGWYIGVETGAAVAQSRVSGSSSLFATSLVNGHLTAAGGTVGGCVGYAKGGAASWWGVQACGDYQNITASDAVVIAGVASRWSATQEVRFGGSTIMGWIASLPSVLPNLGVNITFPTFTPPVLGGAHLAAAPRTYLAIGANEFGISGDFGGATGAKVGIAPMLKAGSIWQVTDAAGRTNGGAIDGYAQVTFAGKGLTLNNVGASGGGVSASGSASMGTVYKAGLAYDFALPR